MISEGKELFDTVCERKLVNAGRSGNTAVVEMRRQYRPLRKGDNGSRPEGGKGMSHVLGIGVGHFTQSGW